MIAGPVFVAAQWAGSSNPELQRRGLFRERYTGSTLREHLGLARPESSHGA
jgi:hypothetical protein